MNSLPQVRLQANSAVEGLIENPLVTKRSREDDTEKTQRISFSIFSKQLSRTVEMVEPVYIMHNGESYSGDRHSLNFNTVCAVSRECNFSSAEMDKQVEIHIFGKKITMNWAPGFDGDKALQEIRNTKKAEQAELLDEWIWGNPEPKKSNSPPEQKSEQKSFVTSAIAFSSGKMKVNIYRIMNNVVSTLEPFNINWKKTKKPNRWKYKTVRLEILKNGDIKANCNGEKFTFSKADKHVGLGTFAVKINDLFQNMHYLQQTA